MSCWNAERVKNEPQRHFHSSRMGDSRSSNRLFPGRDFSRSLLERVLSSIALKIDAFLKSILAFLGAVSLIVACDRIEELQQQQDIRAATALRQFVVEIQIAIIQRSFTNSTGMVDWIESYSSSTNYTIRALRSVCEAVWVNNSYEDWVKSVGHGWQFAGRTAAVAQYLYDAKGYHVCVAFDGTSMKTNTPSISGFRKVHLNEARRSSDKL